MLIDTQKIQGIKRYVTEALNTIQPEGFWNDFLLLVTAVECLQEENEDLKTVSAANVGLYKKYQAERDTAIAQNKALVEAAKSRREIGNDELLEIASELREERDRLLNVVEAARDFAPYLKYSTINAEQSKDRQEKKEKLIAAVEGWKPLKNRQE